MFLVFLSLNCTNLVLQIINLISSFFRYFLPGVQIVQVEMLQHLCNDAPFYRQATIRCIETLCWIYYAFCSVLR